MSKISKTSHAMKQIVLDNGEEIVQQYVNAALGISEFTSTSVIAREEVWKLLTQLMLESSDKLNLKVNDVNDILEAVTSGTCTIKEGKELIAMFKEIKAIESPSLGLPGGSGAGMLNITINTTGNSPEPITVTPSEAIEHED